MAVNLRRQKRVLWSALACGVVYGAVARLVFGLKELQDAFGVMTGAFILLVPFALGVITVVVGEREESWSWWRWIWVPWLAALLALGGALALAWEGIICVALWVPLFMILASLGGIAGGVANRIVLSQRGRGLVLASFVMLPFVVAPLEHRFPLPDDRRVVKTQIEIAADPEIVWRNIARVPAIRPEEQSRSWFHTIGFPRPVEATLSHESVGGVRHASFEGGVVFVETVTDWEPGRRLAFSIAADPASIPQTTLDEHVTVGGPFFDVLRGEYEIEPLAPGRVVLHLASTHRLSTRFNLYSGLWTDFIMRDVQEYILEILKRRCEAAR
jgi:uncharacterized protein YndB with AHSA1/START domain